MSTKTIEPTGDRRSRVFDEMTPALQQIAKEFDERICIRNRGSTLLAYDIGATAAKVVLNEVLYGSTAAEQLAEYLEIPLGVRTIRDYMRLSKAYRRDFVKGQCEEPMANGRPVTLYHLIVLASVPLEKRQTALLTQVREKSLSVEELRQEVTGKAARASSKRGGGRKPKAPSSPEAGLHRLAKQAHGLTEYVAVLDAPVFAELEQMPPAEVNANLLTQIEEAERAAIEATECLKTALERLEEGKARVQNVLRLRREKEKSKGERELQPA